MASNGGQSPQEAVGGATAPVAPEPDTTGPAIDEHIDRNIKALTKTFSDLKVRAPGGHRKYYYEVDITLRSNAAEDVDHRLATRMKRLSTGSYSSREGPIGGELDDSASTDGNTSQTSSRKGPIGGSDAHEWQPLTPREKQTIVFRMAREWPQVFRRHTRLVFFEYTGGQYLCSHELLDIVNNGFGTTGPQEPQASTSSAVMASDIIWQSAVRRVCMGGKRKGLAVGDSVKSKALLKGTTYEVRLTYWCPTPEADNPYDWQRIQAKKSRLGTDSYDIDCPLVPPMKRLSIGPTHEEQHMRTVSSADNYEHYYEVDVEHLSIDGHKPLALRDDEKMIIVERMVDEWPEVFAKEPKVQYNYYGLKYMSCYQWLDISADGRSTTTGPQPEVTRTVRVRMSGKRWESWRTETLWDEEVFVVSLRYCSQTPGADSLSHRLHVVKDQYSGEVAETFNACSDGNGDEMGMVAAKSAQNINRPLALPMKRLSISRASLRSQRQNEGTVSSEHNYEYYYEVVVQQLFIGGYTRLTLLDAEKMSIVALMVRQWPEVFYTMAPVVRYKYEGSRYMSCNQFLDFGSEGRSTIISSGQPVVIRTVKIEMTGQRWRKWRSDAKRLNEMFVVRLRYCPHKTTGADSPPNPMPVPVDQSIGFQLSEPLEAKTNGATNEGNGVQTYGGVGLQYHYYEVVVKHVPTDDGDNALTLSATEKRLIFERMITEWSDVFAPGDRKVFYLYEGYEYMLCKQWLPIDVATRYVSISLIPLSTEQSFEVQLKYWYPTAGKTNPFGLRSADMSSPLVQTPPVPVSAQLPRAADTQYHKYRAHIKHLPTDGTAVPSAGAPNVNDLLTEAMIKSNTYYIIRKMGAEWPEVFGDALKTIVPVDSTGSFWCSRPLDNIQVSTPTSRVVSISLCDGSGVQTFEVDVYKAVYDFPSVQDFSCEGTATHKQSVGNSRAFEEMTGTRHYQYKAHIKHVSDTLTIASPQVYTNEQIRDYSYRIITKMAVEWPEVFGDTRLAAKTIVSYDSTGSFCRFWCSRSLDTILVSKPTRRVVSIDVGIHGSVQTFELAYSS
ncbi:unnamed protein product [Oppiella nova]|uniref:Uncharacterized protein n=1 Tax=Oppiella nova TaxID=334625 RepID=A0A7R9QF52_9ACAR|nr:unnamed protein product [Oppiella nova]CAG2163768.1 unnamed protein product [Oppiella nova]